jgi:hypothetical protein
MTTERSSASLAVRSARPSTFSSTRIGSLAALALVAGAMGALSGCAAEEQTAPASEKTGTVTQAATCTNCSIDDPYGDPGPVVYVPPTLYGVAAQRRAHAVAMYIMGGSNDPFTDYPQRTGTATEWTRFQTQVNRLRFLVQNRQPSPTLDSCWINTVTQANAGVPPTAPIYNASGDPDAPDWQPKPNTTQVPASHFFLYCNGLTNTDYHMLKAAYNADPNKMNSTGLQATMKAVWKGPESFWHEECFSNNYSNWNSTSQRWTMTGSMVIDPEPANLDTSLSGTGSWAYATYNNTGAATYGMQVPKTWTSSWVWAGYPCAEYSATAGTTLIGTVIASGGYKRCSVY